MYSEWQKTILELNWQSDKTREKFSEEKWPQGNKISKQTVMDENLSHWGEVSYRADHTVTVVFDLLHTIPAQVLSRAVPVFIFANVMIVDG